MTRLNDTDGFALRSPRPRLSVSLSRDGSGWVVEPGQREAAGQGYATHPRSLA